MLGKRQAQRDWDENSARRAVVMGDGVIDRCHADLYALGNVFPVALDPGGRGVGVCQEHLPTLPGSLGAPRRGAHPLRTEYRRGPPGRAAEGRGAASGAGYQADPGAGGQWKTRIISSPPASNNWSAPWR